MTPRWCRIVIAAAGVATLVLGFLGIVARNWLWGDAGYSVEARQPIMFLAVTWLAIGGAALHTAIRGGHEALRLIASILTVVVAAAPLVMALNVGGWDRAYHATNWPLPYLTTGFAVLVGTPMWLTVQALRHD